MTKMLITMQGGNIVSVSSNEDDVQIVIIDYDKNADYDNDVSVSEVIYPDSISENMYELFNGEAGLDYQEMAIRTQLKEMNF